MSLKFVENVGITGYMLCLAFSSEQMQLKTLRDRNIPTCFWLVGLAVV
jgi:hypothetical protein